MSGHSQPSFTRGRKWTLSLNAVLAIVALLAIVAMSNYLAARHYQRLSVSSIAQAELSPLSLKVLSAVTNPVKITLYFDHREPLSEMCWNLLKVYRDSNHRIQLEKVDYIHEPGDAQVIKAYYKLGDNDRNIVIFECQKRSKVVHQSDLSDLDMQALLTGRSQEVRRTHFKGEALFTSAILNVINVRQSKAYFLEGHGEHDPQSDDGLAGYSRFAGVLRENNISFDKLLLEGSTEIPTDCNLLIIAGPRSGLQPIVVEKIGRYLAQGGRLLLGFNYQTRDRETGLEAALADWGVLVGRNVVIDSKKYMSESRNDLVTSTFGNHPVIKAVYGFQLYFVLPRSISKHPRSAAGADAPQVDAMVATSEAGRILNLMPDGTSAPPAAGDYTGNIPIMVAVEKGGIRDVAADRGTTRMIVAGDSVFLSNDNIDREANYEFARHAVNWLVGRDDLLVNVPPRPIAEYKLSMTASQMAAARWILLGAFPGTALLLGALVWLRRRR